MCTVGYHAAWKDGFALLPELSGYQIPVIFLTAKGDIQSKIKGLTEGAEDYLVKPFEMLELLVRLEKVMARQGKQEDVSGFAMWKFIRKKRVVKKRR